MKELINILSIDGGGIRGMIPIKFINYIYNYIDIINNFKYYTGSSVGVLIICFLLHPEQIFNFKNIEEIIFEFKNFAQI